MIAALALVASALAAGCGAAASHSGALPFSPLSYAEAEAAAGAQHKLFLVDATASWCAPCRTMESDTWPDPDVRAWLAANALAVQVDVDEEPELAERLKIEAMPTMIAFRDGKELDRHVGGMDPDSLLEWLGSLGP